MTDAPQAPEGVEPDKASGAVPVVHSYIAYFFIPLPEPLGLSDGYQVTCWETTGLEWYSTHDESEHDQAPPVEYVAASLKFHRAQARSPWLAETEILFEVAKRALPPEEVPDEVTGEGPDESSDAQEPEGDRTVVEIAVGFDPEEEQAEDGSSEALSDAFDKGLRYVRAIQRAYFIARRRPLRLVTRETLPISIPVAIRRLYGDDGRALPFRAPLSLYLLNMNLHRDVRDADLDADGMRALGAGLRAEAEAGVFTGYLEFSREADVALDLEGDYRAAAVFAATAAEVILDDLLAHLMWEEGHRPEDAAPIFDRWLMARVKSDFHSRVGGTWLVDRPGPIADWATKVAALRNRVVHGGYEPSLKEARESRSALNKLETFLADRLAAKTGVYPRTALTLPGDNGLKSRGRWTKKLEALRNDPNEVAWVETFHRWRTAMQRARIDSPTYVPPMASRALVLIVRRADGRTQWLLHDRVAAMAARIERHDVKMPSAQSDAIDQVIKALEAEGSTDDVSMAVAGATAKPRTLTWVHEYRLVPMAGVMVNGLDLDSV